MIVPSTKLISSVGWLPLMCRVASPLPPAGQKNQSCSFQYIQERNSDVALLKYLEKHGKCLFVAELA